MSVKLIVVALLAAAAATGRAAGEDATTANTLVIKTCPANTVNCDCATPESTKTYTVGKCTTADGKHWKVDACDANVVKAYTSDTCANATLTLQKACRAVNYHRAECADGKVKLYAGCNSDKCETKEGDNGCKTPTEFTIGEDTPKCLKAGSKYYKLASTKCPASEETQSVSFTQYLQKGCTDAGESVTVPLTCTATGYQKVSCTDADGVSVEACTSADCNNGCTAAKKVPLKEYTQIDSGAYLYIDKCPGDADPVVFNVYADVMKYELGCHGLVNAICGEKSGSDSGSNSSGSGSDSGSNSSGSNSSGSNGSGSDSGSGSGSDSGSNTTTNETTNTTTDTGVIAPAHTVGVLALALCLLACLY